MNLGHWLAYVVYGSKTLPKRRKSRRCVPVRDWRYRAWIRLQPSVISGGGPCEAAHTGSDGGMSMKASDDSCVPLTVEEHREYHATSRRAMEEKYGISFAKIARDLKWQYDGEFRRRAA